MRRRRWFGAVRFGGRVLGRGLGRGEQLSGPLDVARSNRSGEQAIMADAMKAARQDMHEKAANEFGGVERHGPEPIAAFDPIVLTWGASGQGGDSFMRPSSSLGWFGFDFSVFVSVGRYFAVGSWQRK
jgi:hypothetical protein